MAEKLFGASNNSRRNLHTVAITSSYYHRAPGVGQVLTGAAGGEYGKAMEKKPEIFLTGATGFIGKRVARALIEKGRRLALLCRPASTHRLDALLSGLPEQAPVPRVVPGDLHKPDLGLSAENQKRLKNSVGEVYHLAATYDLGMCQKDADGTNVEGTRRMLDLAARLPKLERFHYVSTLAVAGDYPGHFREDDLDVGQEFAHAYGRSKYQAEKLVRESGLPATVFRPGVVVGDSRTGEMDKVDGPYYLFHVLHGLRRVPGILRMPMIVPREDDVYFHMVPVDFVVSSLVELASGRNCLGRTYHLMDPRPITYREFYSQTLRSMGFSGRQISRPLGRTVRLLCSKSFWPATRAAGRMFGMPAEMLAHFTYTTTYSTDNTERDLEGSGIRCPPASEYLDTLIAYFQHNLA
jgi:thioester reductase-like protein